jgi:hypothetical protein
MDAIEDKERREFATRDGTRSVEVEERLRKE